MTRLIDGPAAGLRLLLGRAPDYLRVVCDPGGKWDALDLPADAVAAGEMVTVYRKATDDGVCHIDYSRPRRGEWYRLASYRHLAEQPPETITRDNERWRDWCAAQTPDPTEQAMTATATENPPDPEQIAQQLAAPFALAEIKFKPQTIVGNRALAVPFVDARVIQDRLDEVLGVFGWSDAYDCQADGSVVCSLSIRLGTEWITKMDVGGQSEQPDEGDRKKAAFSDSLKRAAVKFGIGRYLYRQKPQWVDYDPQKRQFVRQPALPEGAGPAQKQPQKSPAKPASPVAEQKPAPPTGQDFLLKVQEYDRKLTASGLCKPGDLVKAVAAAGKAAGHPADLTAWSAAQVQLAREETKAFEGHCRNRRLDQLERLLDAKGETVERLLAKLQMPRGKSCTDLSNEQLAQGVALLSKLPDAVSQTA